MRAGLLAVFVATASVAGLLALSLSVAPTWVRAVLVVLGAWTVVSLAATAFVVSWFRSTARANEALAQSARAADWKGELATR